MKIVRAVIAVGVLFAVIAKAGENPCAGKGTAVFLVNGLFNDLDVARKNLGALEKVIRDGFKPERPTKYDLAWVEGLHPPVQLAMAVAQRGVDDFQRFWLWRSGLEKSPSWFENLVQDALFDVHGLSDTLLPRIDDHLALYSKAILEGYEVIIVSHSAGSFYANAALRMLPDFLPIPQTSINERRKRNPLYPAADEMVTNIQIGTPVKETVNHSPWVNFDDDAVLHGVRKITSALAGNIKSPGSSPADFRAHSLIPSYLRVEESRNRIVEYVRVAHKKLKYPIPYFQPAATVSYLSRVNGKSVSPFFAKFRLNQEDISAPDQLIEGKNLINLTRANCFDLRPGKSEILGETILEGVKSHDFRALGYVGDRDATSHELIMHARHEYMRWRLGSVDVARGHGKSPIEAMVRFLDRPESR